MIFIITILLLASDFYYLKNIAGRRLVGLRWWNEVDPQTGDSQWVFESSEPGSKDITPTDSRFFWLALYIQPMLWVLMFILALVQLQFLWLPLVSTSTLSLSSFPRFVKRQLSPCSEKSVIFYVHAKLTKPLTSHRPRADHYEHPGLLPMRQVQPGIQHGRQRLWRQHCHQHRQQHGRSLVHAQLKWLRRTGSGKRQGACHDTGNVAKRSLLELRLCRMRLFFLLSSPGTRVGQVSQGARLAVKHPLYYHYF